MQAGGLPVCTNSHYPQLLHNEIQTIDLPQKVANRAAPSLK